MGKLTQPNGDTYEGPFVGGKREGAGRKRKEDLEASLKQQEEELGAESIRQRVADLYTAAVIQGGLGNCKNEDLATEMFVIINSTPTRINKSHLVDLYEQGRLPLEKFVTERIGLGDIEAAFTAMHAGTVLRSVVVL